MRKAGQFTAKLLNHVEKFLRPGMSTLEIDEIVYDYTLSHGHKPATLHYKGYPKSCCTSINNVVCHGIPKKTDVLKLGDIINVDVTTVVAGYHGDTSRTFLIGDVTPEAKKLVADTEKSMWIGIEQIRPGNRISDIGNAIDDFLTPMGYGIVRDLTGHGLGKGFHEDPQVPHFRQGRPLAKMEVGMTFTVEPMVNLGTHEVIFNKQDKWTVTTKDGKWSAQFEHTCLVTERGVEILTVE